MGLFFDHAHGRESHPKAADFDDDGQAINILRAWALL
jgi:hypothetical protein